jgi:pyrroloquinoline-quinone synthase
MERLVSRTLSTTGTEGLLQSLDALIGEHSLLSHPFYRAWTEGRLPLDALKLYAVQYYLHVRAFPENLGRLASRTSGALRDLVNENLSEELDPKAPHPALWRRFARAVGASDAILDRAKPLPGVAALLTTFEQLASAGTPAEAVAGFYAYEAQVPEVAVEKYSGLRRFYGITEPEALAYFLVHEEADVRHRAAWRHWLAGQPETDRARILHAATRTAKALWHALDAVYPTGCAGTN